MFLTFSVLGQALVIVLNWALNLPGGEALSELGIALTHTGYYFQWLFLGLTYVMIILIIPYLVAYITEPRVGEKGDAKEQYLQSIQKIWSRILSACPAIDPILNDGIV
jgi:hypothetical protein